MIRYPLYINRLCGARLNSIERKPNSSEIIFILRDNSYGGKFIVLLGGGGYHLSQYSMPEWRMNHIRGSFNLFNKGYAKISLLKNNYFKLM
jgi:hypothetical protein